MTFQSLKGNNHPQIWIREMKIVDYFMIGATIRIGQEMLCLPYTGDKASVKRCFVSRIRDYFFVIFCLECVSPDVLFLAEPKLICIGGGQ